MTAKQCPFCTTVSYSAQTGMPWICPSCGRDISQEAAPKIKKTSKNK